MMSSKKQIRTLLLLLLLLLGATEIHAQNRQFSVASFELDQFDLTARNDQYKKIDGNGSPYAIIKVTSSNPNDKLSEYRFNFGNMNHEVVSRDGELWVYVQRNAKFVTISRQGFTTINKYDLGLTIEEGRTYTMNVSTKATPIYTQMTMFSISPVDARALVSVKSDVMGAVEETLPLTDEDGVTAKNLPLGNYSYKVQAPDYYPQEGHFSLNNSNVTYEEKVTLQARFSMVTLQVDADATIYVDNQPKGQRRWRGRLNSGQHTVECRQQNHRSSSRNITVIEGESPIIELDPPTPVTGMISVISHPSRATIIIDGKDMGMTPRNLSNILIGKHEVIIKKDGYNNVIRDFEVFENQTTNLDDIVMEKAVSLEDKTDLPIMPIEKSLNNDLSFTVTENGKSVTFKMKKVKSGSFTMGNGDSNNSPLHTVEFKDDYYIQETEVTQELWIAVMGKMPLQKWQSAYGLGDDYPAYFVTFNDCVHFIDKLNDKTGKNFRLPTEAEWEYAAKGGNKGEGRKYAGSSNAGIVAWFNLNTSKTHPVKMKEPNELGIYDMSGNVEEWCNDWHKKYQRTIQVNPQGPKHGTYKVVRGGSWKNKAEKCQVCWRSSETRTTSSAHLGFRLALSSFSAPLE